ncbi:uncharacterized protein LOC142335473 [Convolutriloba macropyga]|uniref:uncharacterized protein LOC142335473 n=1 Tax=Convolutriloba macropyga TaxID=536237 RepID=UPI003F52312D
MASVNASLEILDTLEAEENKTGHGLSTFDKQLFSVISYILLFMGFAAFLANLAIFLLLIRKTNKLASEMLVLTNLVIDALYALNLAWTGLFNVTDIFVDKLVSRQFQCVIRRVPYTFLILASLLLLIVMTLNRYVAVKMPFRYKVIFKTSNVIKYLLIVALSSTVFASFDLVLCIFDPHEIKDYSHIFTLIWVYMKFLLIGIVVILMFVMYKSISKQFGDNNFWLPILLPFKALLTCGCQKLVHRSSTSQFELTSMNQPLANKNSANGASKLPTENNLQVAQPQIKISLTRSNSNPVESVSESRKTTTCANSGNFSKQISLLDVTKVNVKTSRSVEHISDQKFIKKEPSSSSTFSKFSKNVRRLSSLLPKRLSESIYGGGASSKTPAELRRERKKHHLTTTFFFISVLFIIVSAPSSLSQVMSHLFPTTITETFSYRLYFVTETLYGLNFLLNPYLYSFNNSYIKRKIRELISAVRSCFGADLTKVESSDQKNNGIILNNQSPSPENHEEDYDV